LAKKEKVRARGSMSVCEGNRKKTPKRLGKESLYLKVKQVRSLFMALKWA